jgi:hypothetical protein
MTRQPNTSLGLQSERVPAPDQEALNLPSFGTPKLPMHTSLRRLGRQKYTSKLWIFVVMSMYILWSHLVIRNRCHPDQWQLVEGGDDVTGMGSGPLILAAE